MEGILKVTPEKLIQTSGEFAAVGNQMKNLTGEMMSQVQGMKGIWQGEASCAYGINSVLFRQTWTDCIEWYRNM